MAFSIPIKDANQYVVLIFSTYIHSSSLSSAIKSVCAELTDFQRIPLLLLCSMSVSAASVTSLYFGIVTSNGRPPHKIDWRKNIDFIGHDYTKMSKNRIGLNFGVLVCAELNRDHRIISLRIHYNGSPSIVNTWSLQ